MLSTSYFDLVSCAPRARVDPKLLHASDDISLYISPNSSQTSDFLQNILFPRSSVAIPRLLPRTQDPCLRAGECDISFLIRSDVWNFHSGAFLVACGMYLLLFAVVWVWQLAHAVFDVLGAIEVHDVIANR